MALFAALGVAVLSWAQAAVAGSLRVDPTRVALAPDGRPEVVRIRNLSPRPTLVQVQAIRWSGEPGQQSGEVAREILAVPPVFELGGNAQQVVRLALRQPYAGDTEQAFRLLIREVPQEVEPGQLALAVVMNLPLFVTPEAARPQPVWTLRGDAQAAPELILANRGSAHIRVERFELLLDGSAEPVFSLQKVAAVLAGQERSWPLDVKSSTLDGPLTVKAETNLGTLEALVALEGN